MDTLLSLLHRTTGITPNNTVEHSDALPVDELDLTWSPILPDLLRRWREGESFSHDELFAAFAELRLHNRNIGSLAATHSLAPLENTTDLSLAGNQLASVQADDLPPRLESLHLGANPLSALRTLATANLKHLGVPFCPITSLATQFEPPSAPCWHTLVSLDASSCQLDNLDETLKALGCLPNLKILSLAGNPLSVWPCYRSRTILRLTPLSLQVLDDCRITTEENVSHIDTEHSPPHATLTVSLSKLTITEPDSSSIPTPLSLCTSTTDGNPDLHTARLQSLVKDRALAMGWSKYRTSITVSYALDLFLYNGALAVPTPQVHLVTPEGPPALLKPKKISKKKNSASKTEQSDTQTFCVPFNALLSVPFSAARPLHIALSDGIPITLYRTHTLTIHPLHSKDSAEESEKSKRRKKGKKMNGAFVESVALPAHLTRIASLTVFPTLSDDSNQSLSSAEFPPNVTADLSVVLS